jgi:polyisoprenoid-binding protein YceI
MKAVKGLVFIVLSMCLTPAIFAQPEKLTVNPDASHVGFGLNGKGHHVEGVFHVQSGSLTFDAGAQSVSGVIVVAAGSGNSGEPSRDKKMNSDVLNTDQFPEISFTPKSFQGSLAAKGDSSIQVSGTFTLHGAAHDLTVPMQIHIDGANLTAKGHFVVPYVQWGLKDPSILILKVAKEVDIDLNLSGSVAPAN